MIDLNYIRGFFPHAIAQNAGFQKHILKEYIQLMVLDYLANTPYIAKLAFIGGTNLRLIKHIDRFSEDIDFDCKDMTEEEFMAMTDDVVKKLQREGLNAIVNDKTSDRLTAFRRRVFFPELLFELGLTGHRDERFLLKVEAQDQGVHYDREIRNVSGCGFFFSLPVPPDAVLLSMKFSALLSRAKGRDFYDAMFLTQQTKPSYEFLTAKCGIHSPEELKTALKAKLSETDLTVKKRDFEHLLFDVHASDRILRFEEFVEEMIRR
jgi:predicted nucleotidyltransferase component of viral defense system